MPVADERNDALLPALAAYAAASLFHHVHNAEFLDQYPNMPAWLSPATTPSRPSRRTRR